MIVFKGEQNLCDSIKSGEFAKVMSLALGIPTTGCPMGNATYCFTEKDNIQLTSTKKFIALFMGSRIMLEATIKHDKVIQTLLFSNIFYQVILT